MLHKKAAYQVVVIAKAFWRLRVGCQQHSGILNGTTRQYELFCFNGMRFAGMVFYGHGSDFLHTFIGIDVYHRGISVQVNILCLHNGVFVGFVKATSKTIYSTDLPNLVPHNTGVEWIGVDIGKLFLPVGNVEIVRA